MPPIETKGVFGNNLNPTKIVIHQEHWKGLSYVQTLAQGAARPKHSDSMKCNKGCSYQPSCS